MGQRQALAHFIRTAGALSAGPLLILAERQERSKPAARLPASGRRAVADSSQSHYAPKRRGFGAMPCSRSRAASNQISLLKKAFLPWLVPLFS
jgi:hypothetical protein